MHRENEPAPAATLAPCSPDVPLVACLDMLFRPALPRHLNHHRQSHSPPTASRKPPRRNRPFRPGTNASFWQPAWHGRRSAPEQQYPSTRRPRNWGWSPCGLGKDGRCAARWARDFTVARCGVGLGMPGVPAVPSDCEQAAKVAGVLHNVRTLHSQVVFLSQSREIGIRIVSPGPLRFHRYFTLAKRLLHRPSFRTLE